MTAASVALPTPPRSDPDAQLLPHNLEAERSCLGAALVAQQATEFIVEKLHPDDFFRRGHQDILRAMRNLTEKKVTVDFVTLKNELGRLNKLEEVGGPAYISSLADGIPRATNIKYYAGILKDLRIKRNLVMFANTTIDFVVANDHAGGDILRDADRRLLELQKGHVAGRMRSLADSAIELFPDLEWRVEHRGELVGLETGYPSINDLTLGWQSGDLIIIAARPSIGKTTLTVNSGVHTAMSTTRDGRKPHVAMFSLEMKRRQLEYRILSQLSGIELTRLLGGHLGKPDYAKLSPAMETMRELNIHIDDKNGQSAIDVRHACRRLKSEAGFLDHVIVDYIQLMPGCLERKSANRNDEVTDIANRLKDLADEMGCPVTGVSQLRRVDGRPKIEDLRESGALEQVADIVGLLHRKNHAASGTTEFILAKQRNGPTGTVHLTINRETTTFYDGGEPEPEPTEKTTKPRKARSRYAAGRRASDPAPSMIDG